MYFTYNIPLLSLFLVLLGAVITPFFKGEGQARRLCQLVALVVTALSMVLLVSLWQAGASFTYTLGHFSAPWGNELRAGPLEGLLATTFSLVMLLSILGGAQEAEVDIPAHRKNGFYLLLLLLYGALLAMVYTNDLFTSYVFIELAAVTACVVVVAKESGKSVVAGIRYLVFSCLGSGLILLGISILYSLTGHLLMADLGRTVTELVASGQYLFPLTVSALLMTLGLSIKSAQFPFHAWLPDAHASATTSASAILSGLVLKGYLVLLIKIMVRVFGGGLLIGTYMHDLLFVLGLVGMLFASVAALRQEDVKRMVAYSSSAQISYIFLALGLDSRAGLAAACFQILAHAVTKPMIFVAVGSMLRGSKGGHYWSDLRGAARRNPVAGIGFTVGGLSLCGLPLLAGFSAKYALAAAALGAGWQTMPALFGLAASSVLNAMYYIPAILAIWHQEEGAFDCPTQRYYPRSCVVAIGCFLLCNFIFGIGVGPVLALINQGLALL